MHAQNLIFLRTMHFFSLVSRFAGFFRLWSFAYQVYITTIEAPSIQLNFTAHLILFSNSFEQRYAIWHLVFVTRLHPLERKLGKTKRWMRSTQLMRCVHLVLSVYLQLTASLISHNHSALVWLTGDFWKFESHHKQTNRVQHTHTQQ